ncbi:hypothetical protein [Streptomyces sp. NPDC048269]|uniref:hypothetical protein n=1 Tax=Streptomyces sp. NPDC048269 TaxID=3155753 RepID=UPI003446CA43
MSIISRRPKPRLLPELDDQELGKAVRLLVRLPTPNMIDIQVGAIAAVVDAADAQRDWDRKAHRLAILGSVVAGGQLPEQWLRRQPNDGEALLFKAWVDVVRGRLSGSISDAAAIAKSCHRVAADNPEDPTPWVLLVALYRLLRRPLPEMAGVWSEVVERDPWNRYAYMEMLDYLSPEECGSHLEWMEFIETVRARTPPDAPTAGLELTAVVRRYVKLVQGGGVQALLSRSAWAQPWETGALERAFRLCLSPGFLQQASALADLNTLAYALVEAERFSEATVVFQALEGVVTSWPWSTSGDAVQRYTKAAERARRRQAA